MRFKPDGSAIEQYSSKGGNTWGLKITGDNRVMWTQPTSGTILHAHRPARIRARPRQGRQHAELQRRHRLAEKLARSCPWEQMAYVQIDLVGSFTAAAGCVIYDGGAWPDEYNGDYFTTEPTINIVHHERLTPERIELQAAASCRAARRPNSSAARTCGGGRSKSASAPMAPIYLADFYNQAVIHNDTRGPDHNKVNAAVRPDRDHYFGRIWKLDHKQREEARSARSGEGERRPIWSRRSSIRIARCA